MDDTAAEDVKSSMSPAVGRSFKKSSILINEGVVAGQKIAKISVITLISIGIVELLTGFVSGSVVATADGIGSISYAEVSFIVFLGLRFGRNGLLSGSPCRNRW